MAVPLFIIAVTVCRFIRDIKWKPRLKMIMRFCLPNFGSYSVICSSFTVFLPSGSHCRYYCSFAVSLRYLLQLLYAYCPFALRVGTYSLFRKDQLSKDFVRGTLSTQP